MAGALQLRVESRPVGKLAISVLVLLALAAMTVANLPDSLLRREIFGAAGPYLEATGLNQSWSVFAPDPRRASVTLAARVHYADGSSAIWRPPSGSDAIGAYWDYRWRKWTENAVKDTHRGVLWKDAALFVARQMRRPDSAVTRVTLHRRWQRLRPAGATGGAPGWHSSAFYQFSLLPGTARR